MFLIWIYSTGLPNLSLPVALVPRVVCHFGSAGVGAWDGEHGWKQLLKHCSAGLSAVDC